MNNFDKFFLNSDEKSYYAAVEGDDKSISITLIDDTTNQVILKHFGKDVQGLLDFIPNLFTKKFNAVMLEVFDCQLFSPLFKSNHEFCVALKAKFMEGQIPTYFITNEEWLLSRILVQVKYSSKINEVISILTLTGELCGVADFEFTKNGYRMLFPRMFLITKDVGNNRKEALQRNPKMVILVDTGDDGPTHMEQLKLSLSQVSKVLDFSKTEFTEELIIQALKRFIDKKDIQCSFVPQCFKNCTICTKANKNPILRVRPLTELPVRIAETVDKLVDVIEVTYDDKYTHGKPITLFSPTPTSMAHRHEVILSVDEQNFVSYEVKPIILKDIKKLPNSLAKKKIKIPVIGFLRNLSFICLRKSENSEYEFLQSWNGIYGKDLYLSFDQEKPKFGEDALKFLQTKPTSVVYDIIKIMALSTEKANSYHSENFKITKDANNPVLLEFVNHEGNEKAASPSFLMALMLKEHFKAIKDEIGEKPKEVGIVVFDHLTAVERNRVETKIIEACKMLKVDGSIVKV